MFVLYAESRQLIDPEGKQAKKEYEQNFSLNQHRLDIHDTIGEVDTGFEDEYSTYSTTIWNDLQDLFRLVDQERNPLAFRRTTVASSTTTNMPSSPNTR